MEWVLNGEGEGLGEGVWQREQEGTYHIFFLIIQNTNFIMPYYNIWYLWQYKVPVFDDEVS